MILSLYDISGLMVQPWLDRGEQAVIIDIQADGETQQGNLLQLNWDIVEAKREIVQLARMLGCKFMMAFPPCTDLAASGAKHFEDKRAFNPRFQEEAMELVFAAKWIGDQLGVPYGIENPVGKITEFWRESDFSFQPSDYGGYLPPWDLHPLYPKHIAPQDAYTKLTCIWAGNGFTKPPVRPVKVSRAEQYSKQMAALGGTSQFTKNVRSATPRGWAEAVAVQQLGERNALAQTGIALHG